jgi:hypothetical protein
MDYDSICAELNIELEKELSDRLDEIVSLENIYSMSAMNDNERCTGVFYKPNLPPEIVTTARLIFLCQFLLSELSKSRLPFYLAQ